MKLSLNRFNQRFKVPINCWVESWITLWKQFLQTGWQPRQRQWLSRVLFVVLFGLSFLVSCATTPPAPLRVAVNLWPGYETLYLARSLGYYGNAPIELIDFPSGTEQVKAFRNGTVEAAALSLDQAFVLATTHPDIRVITVMDFSEGGDVILAKPTIPNVQSLQGKRVGLEANALGAYIITRALERVNLSIKDIQIVSLDPSEHERAFETGAIDAAVTFGPARVKLLEAGAKQIFDSSNLPGEIVDVLVVREAFLTHHPETVKALVKGHFRGLDYLNQHPMESARRIAPRTQVTPAQFLDSLKGLRSPDLSENQVLLGHSPRSLLQLTQRLVEVMTEHNLLPGSVNLQNLFYDQTVKKIVELNAETNMKPNTKPILETIIAITQTEGYNAWV
jgi:NitT/TauT family transport system substrate-binding protein